MKAMKIKSMNYSVVLAGMLLLLLFGCKKDAIMDISSITDATVTNITTTAATANAKIGFDGGAPVSARGVCWSTNQNPTITDNKTSDGAGLGSFPSSITGLTPVTTYYLRAYAINSIGTSYSDMLTFTTLNLPVTVKDIDGNVYHSVTIGTQTWMVENLKTTKFRNGDPIPNITDAAIWATLSTGARCSYGNDENNAVTYGRLYNWYAANDSRNIAPNGWHVPTADEWGSLVGFEGGTSFAGYKLMQDNQTGFTVLLGGSREIDGSYGFISSYGNWWCSNQFSASKAFNWQMCHYNTTINETWGYKSLGYSIRCIKD
jgi:uncharacterized protein (TIGR02145 family)